MPKTPRKAPKPALPVAAKIEAPTEGFAGEKPGDEVWFRTNVLAFRDGKLHQLYKRNPSIETDGETVWWWYPVDSI